MTNYDQLFQQQMNDPEFAKAYDDARMERLVDDMLTTLKEKIFHDEPKENLLHIIDSMQHQMDVTRARRPGKTTKKTVGIHS